MNFKEKPVMVYIIFLLALFGSLYLIFFSEGFTQDIMVELIGAVFFILIIDQLLLKSRRKRWKIVKDEIEYILQRTIHTFREDLLIKMFSYKPEINKNDKSLEETETNIRQQKQVLLREIKNMDSQRMMDQLTKKFLKEEYSDYFQEKAEDLWRILNNKYTEHLDPDVVNNLLKLNIFIRDLNTGIKTYKKADKYPEKEEYYHKKGGKNITYNTRHIIDCLFELEEQGYSAISHFEE